MPTVFTVQGGPDYRAFVTIKLDVDLNDVDKDLPLEYSSRFIRPETVYFTFDVRDRAWDVASMKVTGRWRAAAGHLLDRTQTVTLGQSFRRPLFADIPDWLKPVWICAVSQAESKMVPS